MRERFRKHFSADSGLLAGSSGYFGPATQPVGAISTPARLQAAPDLAFRAEGGFPLNIRPRRALGLMTKR